METKWTPGPWEAGETIEDDRHQLWRVIRRAESVTVPAYSVAAVPCDALRHHANLALVLAAPDLYHALAALLAPLGPGGYVPGAGKPATDRARAALAKARGETP
jgi:hypothetical protein